MTSSRSLLLWLAVVGAPLAWATQLALGYLLEDFGCAADGGSGSVAGLEPRTLEIVLTAAALLVVAAAALAALTFRRADDEGTIPRYVPFLALGGLIAAAVFSLAILLSGAGVVVLEPCVQS